MRAATAKAPLAATSLDLAVGRGPDRAGRTQEVEMVSIPSLWLPILVSAVIVFVVSTIIHMMLGYHRTDFRKLPSEDEIMETMRKVDVPPGDYMMPYAGSMDAMRTPEFMEKFKKGPRAVMTVMRGGSFDMRKSLTLWFLYCIVVSVFAAYVAGRALPPGTPYLQVFRFAGCTAFIAYTLAIWPTSIWYQKSWTTNLRHTFDGLIYGLMTAGTFGWLWPR